MEVEYYYDMILLSNMIMILNVRVFLTFIFLNLLSSQKYDSLFIEAGNRGYYYKVWVYFDKKVDEKYISLSSKNLNRRVKNNSNFKNNWYDQKISEKIKKELRRLGFQIENESRYKCCNCKCSKSDLSKYRTCSL